MRCCYINLQQQQERIAFVASLMLLLAIQLHACYVVAHMYDSGQGSAKQAAKKTKTVLLVGKVMSTVF